MIRTRLSVLGAGLVLAAAAFAHSTVKSTVPASGSILAASPEEIVLEFNEPAVVTSVVVIDAGQVERKLAFAPSGSAATFTIPAPALTAGRNEIRWAALSGDGHPVTGTIILVIKPAIAHADHRDG